MADKRDNWDEDSIEESNSMKRARGRLGSILVERGHLHPLQLDRALWMQASKWPGKRLGRILVDLGMISSARLYSALCYQNNLPETIL